MRSATITMTLAAATGLLLAGCSSTTTGLGTPAAGAQTSSPGTSGGGASNGVPKVTTPLDTTRYQHAPCTALTAAQVQQLGIAGSGTVTTTKDAGPTCEWDLTGIVGIVFDVAPDQTMATGRGLAYAYSLDHASNLRRLPDIDGQPAVTQVNVSDGGCTVFVGATDGLDYQGRVSFNPDSPLYSKACSVALQIVQAATKTMKSGA